VQGSSNPDSLILLRVEVNAAEDFPLTLGWIPIFDARLSVTVGKLASTTHEGSLRCARRR
jgi:hypothetical protein